MILGVLGIGIFGNYASLGFGILTGIVFVSILVPCILVGAVLIILGIVIKRNVKHVVQVEKVDEEPLKVLKMRYAKGEITREEFIRAKKDLK